jgi:polysaccharide export outer membrane protein
VATQIEHRLAGKALDPQVLVLDLASPANSVSVSGAVVQGRRVALEPGGQRLLQVIAAAGGARAPARDVFVSLSRNGVNATIPMTTLVADPAEDIYARPGDDVTIVRIPKTFSVFGATGENKAITFDADRLSLAQAVAKAGGLLDERADPRGVFLLRYEPDRIVRALGEKVATGERDGFSPIVYRLDLHDARAYLLAREFSVHDKDIIYVSNAKVVALYKFFTLLSTLTGPVESGFLDCYYTHC